MVTLLKTVIGDIFVGAIISGLITYIGVNYFVRLMNKVGIIPVMSYSTLFKIFKVLFVVCTLVVLFNSGEGYVKDKKLNSEIQSNSRKIVGTWENTHTGMIIQLDDKTIKGMNNDTLYYNLDPNNTISIYSGADKSSNELVAKATYSLPDNNTLELKNSNGNVGEYKRTDKKSQSSGNDKSTLTSTNTKSAITNEQALAIVKKVDAADELKIIDENFNKDDKTYIIIEPIPESDHNFAVDKSTGKLYSILPDSSMTPIQQ